MTKSTIFEEIDLLFQGNTNRKKRINKLGKLLSKVEKNTTQYHATNATLLYTEGYYQDSIKAAKKSLNLDTNNRFALCIQGYSYLRLKRFRTALNSFKRVVAIDHDYTLGWIGISHVYFFTRMYDKCIEASNKALEIDPTNASPWKAIGDSFVALNDNDTALKAYDKGLDIDHENIKLYFSNALVYIKLEKYLEALEIYNKVVELDNEADFLWNNIGYVNHLMENYPEAVRSYNKAIKIDGTIALPYHNISNIYKKLGKKEDSKKAFKIACEVQDAFLKKQVKRNRFRSNFINNIQAFDGLIYQAKFTLNNKFRKSYDHLNKTF